MIPVGHHNTRPGHSTARLRVIFRVRVADGAQDRFLREYRLIRHRVARVDGYLGDQLCQSEDDPADWVITSEWRTPAHFHTWEAGAGHRELVAPLMAWVTARESLRYHVRLTTTAEPTPLHDEYRLEAKS
ncbi:antibiotic biosynthesis monooxygenase [Saccharothrix carnea]|uniref:Antibiotic biosynthesis monooxygenase n=1 Tax=Saccharothrix carnea TaxID=1280637 RepID=A0A2P8HZ45_SACCR|nr:antibiotic biosynthesis monooxygenase [Saccharothrix carnea]